MERCDYLDIDCDFNKKRMDNNSRPNRMDCNLCIKMRELQLMTSIFSRSETRNEASEYCWECPVCKEVIKSESHELIDDFVEQGMCDDCKKSTPKKWWLISDEDIKRIGKVLANTQDFLTGHGIVKNTIVDEAIHILDTGLHETDVIPSDWKVDIIADQPVRMIDNFPDFYYVSIPLSKDEKRKLGTVSDTPAWRIKIRK